MGSTGNIMEELCEKVNVQVAFEGINNEESLTPKADLFLTILGKFSGQSSAVLLESNFKILKT